MDTIRLSIVTPQREAYKEDVNFVTVPTENGAIGILPKHAALVTVLVEGEIQITAGGKQTFLAIGGGFMQVTKKEITILVSRAVHADELNEAEIHKAQAAAQDAVKQKAPGMERAEAQAILRRSFVELKVLRHRKRHTSLGGQAV